MPFCIMRHNVLQLCRIFTILIDETMKLFEDWQSSNHYSNIHLSWSAESWFDIHYNDPTVPQEYFRQQLRVNKNILGPKSERQNSRFRNCLPPENVLALGRYRLAHGNSYSSIWPAFNVGKSTVMEAVQNVVKGLYEHQFTKRCGCNWWLARQE